ncbi:MAG: RNA 2',3'-cyclic phosphodiesterase [Isosphaeraceae bacterium]
MRDSTRTFIAIPIPDPIGRQLARWQQGLAPEVPGCRWTEAGCAFHITLAFLGEVPSRDLSALCLAVGEAVGPFSRFDLKVAGLGAFPGPGRPRVLWAGITADDLAPLQALRQAVVEAAAQSGYPPDDPRFHPHVTLGRPRSDRKRPPVDLTDLVRREERRALGSFTVTEVVTYASTLGPDGPTYAPLNRARLQGKKTEATH